MNPSSPAVLVIGATGYLGSVVTRRLLDDGHRVVAFLRAADAATSALPADVEIRTGDLLEPTTLAAAVTEDVTAVVNMATPLGTFEDDSAAAAAVLDVLAGSGRAYLYTSGVWVLGATGERTLDETAPTQPIPLVGYRPRIEQQVLAAAARGVRSVVVRPGVAHGNAGGIPALLVRLAGEHGHGVYVGESAPRWPMVHVDDLADLVVTALRSAPAGALYHAVSEPAVDTRLLARAAARAAGVTPVAEPWPLREAAEQLGAEFAEALACDQSVAAERARRELGWEPRALGALDDLEQGSYSASLV